MEHFAANYVWVKMLHVSCVVLSISLFVLRGTLELTQQPWRQWRLLRVLPHVNDTVLLASATWLAWQLGQFPFVNTWLTAKVLALLAYIVLGMRVMGQNTPKTHKPIYFSAALLSVAYIVGVALTRSPSWGWITQN